MGTPSSTGTLEASYKECWTCSGSSSTSVSPACLTLIATLIETLTTESVSVSSKKLLIIWGSSFRWAWSMKYSSSLIKEERGILGTKISVSLPKKEGEILMPSGEPLICQTKVKDLFTNRKVHSILKKTLSTAILITLSLQIWKLWVSGGSLAHFWRPLAALMRWSQQANNFQNGFKTTMSTNSVSLQTQLVQMFTNKTESVNF